MQLAELRKKQNLTQQELAHKIGVSRQLIQAVEIGNYKPYPSLKKRIAKALGCRVSEVFPGGGNDGK